MGPRSIDRGIDAAALFELGRREASMGPRSIDRGILAARFAGQGLSEASMGPRSIDRGIEPSRLIASGFAPLQWGRDQLIAELQCRFEPRGPKPSFNGAAIN